jgi:hypothetical protein
MAYGVILLPHSPAPFLTLSDALAARGAPLMKLHHQQSPPHVSVAHFESAEQSAISLWESLPVDSGTDISLGFAGIMFSRIPVGDQYVPEGGVYVGLECKNSEALRSFHADVAARLTSAQHRILSPSGADYRPHLTLGVLRTPPDGPIPLPGDVLDEQFACRAALGRLGPYGTFPQIIATT